MDVVIVGILGKSTIQPQIMNVNVGHAATATTSSMMIERFFVSLET